MPPKKTRRKDSSIASHHFSIMIIKTQQAKLTYSSFRAQILRKWDWWIYCRAFHSLRRMAADNPGLTYLMEVQIREWNEKSKITPALQSSAEVFHAAMRDTIAQK